MRFSYQATTVITVGWSEVCSFLKVMRKTFTQFVAVCFHKITFHLLFTNYTITVKQTQKVTAIIILCKDLGCVLQKNFKRSVGAARKVPPNWSQETMAADTRSVLYYITTLDQKWKKMYNSLLKSSLGSLLKFSSRF